FFSSRRRHTRFSRGLEFRRVLFRSRCWNHRFVAWAAAGAPRTDEAVIPTAVATTASTTERRRSVIKKASTERSKSTLADTKYQRSEERRVGKECRSRW